MTNEEIESIHTPSQIFEKAEAYLKGKGIQNGTELSYKKCATLHYSVNTNIFGPANKDATNLNKLLNLMKSHDPDSLCEALTKKQEDGTEKLVNFVISTQNMKKLYQVFNDVVLIDSTYKTNRFRMPLLLVAGVSEESKTFLLGFAALNSEEEDNVQWALKRIFQFLQKTPTIICTDSCPTLKKVLNSVSPQSIHLLCGWHVNQNIIKHLGPIRKYHYFNS